MNLNTKFIIKCTNKECENYNIINIMYLDQFLWRGHRILNKGQWKYSEDLFFQLPAQLHCRECFGHCVWEIIKNEK